MENGWDFVVGEGIENVLGGEGVGEEEEWVGNGGCVVNVILVGGVGEGEGVGEEVGV